jgi:hypothetical protein
MTGLLKLLLRFAVIFNDSFLTKLKLIRSFKNCWIEYFFLPNFYHVASLIIKWFAQPLLPTFLQYSSRLNLFLVKCFFDKSFKWFGDKKFFFILVLMTTLMLTKMIRTLPDIETTQRVIIVPFSTK